MTPVLIKAASFTADVNKIRNEFLESDFSIVRYSTRISAQS